MKALISCALVAMAVMSCAQVQLTEGHLDLGLAYDGGLWEPHIHDEDNNLEYATDEAYFYYGTNARFGRPGGSGYDFIGVAAGTTIWRNFTNNVVGIPWLGFGLEEIAPGTFDSYLQTDPRRDPISAEWVDIELLSFAGPGQVSFFQGGGASPTVWFATADGIDSSDRFISTVGGHEHGSFAFTQPGIYALTLRASAVLGGTRIYSDPYTYFFGVETTMPRISGTAQLGGFAGPTEGGTLLVEVWQGGSLVEAHAPTLGPNGEFSFSPIVSGGMTLRCQFRTGLWKAVVVNLGSEPEIGVDVFMDNGDCDGDNEVAIGDYAVLSAAYGSNFGQGTWDVRADLNGDDTVDIGDYALLSSNYGLVGD